MHDNLNRRTFLRAAMAAGAAWVVTDLADVEAAVGWAAQQSTAGGAARLSALTRLQADAVDAIVSRILPAVEGRAGAREAGALYFIDRALATFNAGQKRLYVEGIAALNRRAAAVGGSTFASLAPTQQDGLLREIEKTPFFEALRFDTIVGTFALPTWGGNRDYAGWHLLGFEHQPRFQAPFGYYDGDVGRRG